MKPDVYTTFDPKTGLPIRYIIEDPVYYFFTGKEPVQSESYYKGAIFKPVGVAQKVILVGDNDEPTHASILVHYADPFISLFNYGLMDVSSLDLTETTKEDWEHVKSFIVKGS